MLKYSLLRVVNRDDDGKESQNTLSEVATKIADLRTHIVTTSRQNFVLEKDVRELDVKIMLLIQKRITVAEVEKASALNRNEKADQKDSERFRSVRKHYEELFFMLQSEPSYFVKLASLVEQKDVKEFVQTVVFDMYGDQYDNREERLLLTVFEGAIEIELQRMEIGSFMRDNTPVTHMVSAYARRGQGIGVLKGVLDAPIKELCKQHSLNLDLNPMNVYKQLIKEMETTTGECDWPRNAGMEAIMERKEVQEELAERTEALTYWAEKVLGSILDQADKIPIGIRWLCKTIKRMTSAKFTDATPTQIGSLVGGFIYLRFFNPMIVAPHMINIVEPPSKGVKKNLIMIAKCLQTLSNGMMLGVKEAFMAPMNVFIERSRPKLLKYFDTVCTVDDFDTAAKLDKYLNIGSQGHIQTSINQILLLHKLVATNLDALCEGASKSGARHLRATLEKLGEPMAPLPRKDNHLTNLSLIRRNTRFSTLASFHDGTGVEHTSFLRTKHLLNSLLRDLAPDSDQLVRQHIDDLMGFLDAYEKVAPDQANDVADLKVQINTLANGRVVDTSDAKEVAQILVQEIEGDITGSKKDTKQAQSLCATVEEAYDSIMKHKKYLTDRVDMYKQYLVNVRMQAAFKEQMKKKSKKKGKSKLPTAKFKHETLVETKIVAKLHQEVPAKILRSLWYTFQKVDDDQYQIEVTIKKILSIKVFSKPIKISMSNLLEMQERDEYQLELENVTLNVNLLVHLLHKEFSGLY